MLYLGSAGVAYYIQNSASDLLGRYYDAAVWMRVRTYYDYALISSASYFVQMQLSNNSQDIILRAKNAMIYNLEAHKNVTSSFFKGLTVEGVSILNGTSPAEFWNMEDTKLYFGNNCVELTNCNSPVLGHRGIMMTSKLLKSISNLQWSDDIVLYQLSILESSRYLDSQLRFLEKIDIEFESRYQFVEDACGFMIGICILMLLVVYKLSMRTIKQLARTHNRIKILKEICVGTAVGQESLKNIAE
eukprot:NODE_37_length_35953_cov_1.028037.p4 type:complete len:245 gc:universal NODE_37_length_35953_cov_1.028037:12321-13055(+)